MITLKYTIRPCDKSKLNLRIQAINNETAQENKSIQSIASLVA